MLFLHFVLPPGGRERNCRGRGEKKKKLTTSAFIHKNSKAKQENHHLGVSLHVEAQEKGVKMLFELSKEKNVCFLIASLKCLTSNESARFIFGLFGQ